MSSSNRHSKRSDRSCEITTIRSTRTIGADDNVAGSVHDDDGVATVTSTAMASYHTAATEQDDGQAGGRGGRGRGGEGDDDVQSIGRSVLTMDRSETFHSTTGDGDHGRAGRDGTNGGTSKDDDKNDDDDDDSTIDLQSQAGSTSGNRSMKSTNSSNDGGGDSSAGWSFQEVGMDDQRSLPFDETSTVVLPIPTAGDTTKMRTATTTNAAPQRNDDEETYADSIFSPYSVRGYRTTAMKAEDDGDETIADSVFAAFSVAPCIDSVHRGQTCQDSVTDVEEAYPTNCDESRVSRSGRSVPNTIRSASTRTVGLGSKSMRSELFPLPKHISPLQVLDETHELPPEETPGAEPSKKQRRCTMCFLALLAFNFLAIVGLGLVLYFWYHRFSTPLFGSEKQSMSPAMAPTIPEFDYVVPNITTPNPTLAPTLVPVTSGPTDHPSAAPTPSPTVSMAVALTDFLSQNYSVGFSTTDPSAPNALAVEWLVEEAAQVGTSTIVLNDRIVQRFALVTLDIRWNEVSRTNGGNYSSFAQTLVDECLWEGIVCDVDNQVTELAWGDRNLQGRILPEIGLLTSLKRLDLSQNQLRGSLPGNFYKLTALEELYLYKNTLSGTLSDRMANLRQLTHLHLSHNQLGGSIPLAMRSPTDVVRPYRYINLYSNNFSGPIPSDLRWHQLWYLDLGRNSFSGSLPSDMDDLVSLRHLHLDHNRFNGTIPELVPPIGDVPPPLVSLSLNHNLFTGAFPAESASTWQIASLTLQNNSLTERLSHDLCALNVLDESGGLVELKADCSICSCWDPFCTPC